jgi:hypothetical protein
MALCLCFQMGGHRERWCVACPCLVWEYPPWCGSGSRAPVFFWFKIAWLYLHVIQVKRRAVKPRCHEISFGHNQGSEHHTTLELVVLNLAVDAPPSTSSYGSCALRPPSYYKSLPPACTACRSALPQCRRVRCVFPLHLPSEGRAAKIAFPDVRRRFEGRIAEKQGASGEREAAPG